MIVYIETNFILGQAKGQSGAEGGAADELLKLADPAVLRVILPDLCLLEAWQAYRRLTRRRARFASGLDAQINDVRRDASGHASALLGPLEQARLGWANLTNDIERRFTETVQKLVGDKPEYPPVERLVTPPEAVLATLQPPPFRRRLKPADFLILNTVLAHAAATEPGRSKVFLSGNSKDFGQADVKPLLKAAGIKYLPQAAVVLELYRRGGAGPAMTA